MGRPVAIQEGQGLIELLEGYAEVLRSAQRTGTPGGAERACFVTMSHRLALDIEAALRQAAQRVPGEKLLLARTQDGVLVTETGSPMTREKT